MMPAQIALELEQLAVEPFLVIADTAQVPVDLLKHWQRVSVEGAETIRNCEGAL
jgi:hypothetical protein